ncbi:DsbC family protein [Sphingobium baderi]|uniref:DsbC family protein n=1 Tax=Sphingobium baderi TaxID=1332080 RepID=UPI002B40A8B7|nr:DsbC family protein [Sphingobium baderi]WRD78831.1 DsbC family protein [Sphingobium baderi]
MSATDLLRAMGRAARPFRFMLAAGSAVGLASLALAADVHMPEDAVRTALRARLPRTPVDAVDCVKVQGLCEIVAGANLFYVDPGARFLIIGRVYDMQTRQDLTAARLLELNPDMLVGAAASANAAVTSAHAQAAPGAPVQEAASGQGARRLSLDGLGKEGAILWGDRTGPRVTVFTDFRCSYCRALTNVLRDMNVQVIERPISVLGSRALAERVYCAKNPERALHAAYGGEPVEAPRSCDTSGLDANEAFAREHGLNGTPVIVRSDGAVLEGYRPRAFLEQWLKDVRS